MLSVALVEGFARDAGQRRGQLDGNLAQLARIVDLVFRPVTALGRVLERLLGRLLPAADDSATQRDVEAERFREVVTAEADVSAAEEELLHGVFSLGDTEVREIMVPRVNVVGIERQTPWSEVVDRISSSEHARFPVYDDTLDNVVGVIYAKDLLPAVVTGEEPANEWTSLMRPAVFIPGTKRIDRQLRDFKNDRTHIALIADEYGGTAGVVTIEDILEEIVGEIRDEYDEEEPSVEQEGSDRFWVSGIVSLADLSELLGTDFQRDDLTTVGGLVYDAFGHVPLAGESRETNGFRMVVERVRRRRIERVYFERLEPVAPGRISEETSGEDDA
jgi:putative hemolysin